MKANIIVEAFLIVGGLASILLGIGLAISSKKLSTRIVLIMLLGLLLLASGVKYANDDTREEIENAK